MRAWGLDQVIIDNRRYEGVDEVCCYEVTPIPAAFFHVCHGFGGGVALGLEFLKQVGGVGIVGFCLGSWSHVFLFFYFFEC
jgi:hypothetical protein